MNSDYPAPMPPITRRMMIATTTGCLAFPMARVAAADFPELRLGILQFGTVQWIADIIRRHGLDTKHGFILRSNKLANTDAGRVSLMADANDVVVSDWLFAAVQRANGTKLCFAAFSDASGGIMTAANSPIKSLADLRGRNLGVVGGPVDKSWLIVKAAGQKTQNIDLSTDAKVVYGAPPLLGAKMQQGELDAVLTFWNFAAKLQATGFIEAVSVTQCAIALGLPARMSMLGFVFHEAWADANRATMNGFLAAVEDAQQLLIQSDVEWQAVRPLMDASEDALFVGLRNRFLAGVAHDTVILQEKAAENLFAILHDTGGSRATGGIDALPQGIFWTSHGKA